MAKKRNHNQKSFFSKKPRAEKHFLPASVKAYLWGLAFILVALIILLSFFGLAGNGGRNVFDSLLFLIGRSSFLLPLFLILTGAIFFFAGLSYQRIWKMAIIAFLSCIFGLSSVLNSYDGVAFSLKAKTLGGFVGYFLSLPILKIFGFWVNLVVFGGLLAFGFFIFWQVAIKIKPQAAEELEEKPQLLKRIFEPKLKIKEIKDSRPERETVKTLALELKTKPIIQGMKTSIYKKPTTDLLEFDRGEPTTGDIRNNMAIIKNTLENFGIAVEMGEANIGPTVTQYTLKPAEGVKLSKITTLSNDLSLALAANPIRIEAPIPGKSLVGIEIPNKIRTQVRLRNIFETPEFRASSAPLLLAIGRDVAGNACFADLTRMPHLLVAGSTGTGKTICLNSIILSLIYRNSPEMLRLILVDPKRVEFPVYQDIPHLLSPVIYDSQKTVNALKWLVKEMERRFEVLAAAKSRDIGFYNKNIALAKATKADDEDIEPMPYIVVIVDELADLIAARGKDVEAGIVRLAQMARAVGIHLVVATQRPSVEVITGLIKANITSRITFQVASQIDSRTVIDGAGAEKLLGAGDMLFISSETAKPKRIQGGYVTDKEVKRVADFLRSQREEFGPLKENFLAEELERELKTAEHGQAEDLYSASAYEDPLYSQAKQWVIESKKASASLLQRRLRVGYARAARLLDILEDRGIVGPADGAKPREVYFGQESPGAIVKVKVNLEEEKDSENDDWEKV